MTTEKEKKKPDEVILFPEAKVTVKRGREGKEEEVIVYPWTFGTLLEVNPHLESIFIELESKGKKLTLENFGFDEIKDIYFIVAPKLLEILRLTLDNDDDYIKELHLDSIIKIVYTIWIQNRESLTSVSALFAADNYDLAKSEEIEEELS